MAFDGVLPPALEPDIFGLPLHLAVDWFKPPRLPMTPRETATISRGHPLELGGGWTERMASRALIAAGCVDPLTRHWREISAHVWGDGVVTTVDLVQGTVKVGGQFYWRVHVRALLGIPLRDAVRAYGDENEVRDLRRVERAGWTLDNPVRPGDADLRTRLEQGLMSSLLDRVREGRLFLTAEVEGARTEITCDSLQRAQIDPRACCVRVNGTELSDVRVSQPDPEAVAASVLLVLPSGGHGPTTADQPPRPAGPNADAAPADAVDEVQLILEQAGLRDPVALVQEQLDASGSKQPGYKAPDSYDIRAAIRLMARGEAQSWNAAAQIVAPGMKGLNTGDESKCARLGRLVVKLYGEEGKQRILTLCSKEAARRRALSKSQ
jgi:hypothetical protein